MSIILWTDLEPCILNAASETLTETREVDAFIAAAATGRLVSTLKKKSKNTAKIFGLHRKN